MAGQASIALIPTPGTETEAITGQQANRPAKAAGKSFPGATFGQCAGICGFSLTSTNALGGARPSEALLALWVDSAATWRTSLPRASGFRVGCRAG